jgi:hypothetical protein
MAAASVREMARATSSRRTGWPPPILGCRQRPASPGPLEDRAGGKFVDPRPRQGRPRRTRRWFHEHGRVGREQPLNEEPGPFQVPRIVVGRDEHQVELTELVADSRERRIGIARHEPHPPQAGQPAVCLLERDAWRITHPA